MKKIILKEEDCARFNSLRNIMQGKTLQTKEVEKLLKEELGWKVTANLMASVVKYQCLIRTGRGKYIFPKEPVHIKKLQEMYAHRNTVSRSGEHITPQLNRESAIKLLKDHGYKIYQPTIRMSVILENKTTPAGQLIEWVEL